MWKNNRNCEFCRVEDDDFINYYLIKLIFVWLFVVVFLILLKWFFNGLRESREERMTGKMDYMYCNDCSNPSAFSCVSLKTEREDLKDDLCSIERHNWQYRKTLYKSPAFEKYEQKKGEN